MAAVALLTLLLARGAEPGDPVPPADPDADGDGLSDFQERHKYRTDPAEADTDGDGVPDGDWDERRERTYSIRCVVSHLAPAGAVSDDWQDARVLDRSEDAVEIEIVAYPLSTADVDIPDDREWRAKSKGFAAFTRPNLTCDFDAAMTKDLVGALEKDGIDPEALGDRSLVEKVSAWAVKGSRTVSMGFSSFAVALVDGRLGVAPGLAPYFDRAREQAPVFEDGTPVAADLLPARRTVEEQLDAEIRGRAMFRRRVRGSCTSSAVYLQTVLRALGVPTRTTVAMPPADANDPAELARLRAGLRPSALRDAIVAGAEAGGGWTEHTFDVVRVGGRWRRLDYARLGAPVVNRHALGLVLRVLDYDDLAASGVSATWGRKWANGERTPRFPTANPYRVLSVSDRLGPHATLALPPPAPARAPGPRTITAAAWGHVPESLGPQALAALAGAEALEVRAGDSGPVVFEHAPRLVLRAAGAPDVPAPYTGITRRDGEGLTLLLRVVRSDLRPGVAYALVPKDEEAASRWKVADGVEARR